jgi:hypothetical protein
MPSFDVIEKITRLWNNALKKACKQLFPLEKRGEVNVFVSGVYDNRIIDYLTKQWKPINKLILKDTKALSPCEIATILTHYSCKAHRFQQIRNSEGIDEIKLEEEGGSHDSLLLFHDNLRDKNTHYFIKLYITLDTYKEYGLTLNDFPTSLAKFDFKNPSKPLLKPFLALKSIVEKYRRAFDLILQNCEKNEYWLNRIYTIEDLISISFDGDLFFMQQPFTDKGGRNNPLN